MIDLHAHVLPGVDDGPSEIEESIAMCRDAVGQGVHTVVATPHLFCGIGIDDLNVIRLAADRLRGALAGESMAFELRVAGEIRLVEDLLDRIQKKTVPFYDASHRYLLIEAPFAGGAADLLKHTIFQLRLRGMVPVIAHPERAGMFLETPGLIEQVVRQGAVLQVTAGSLLSDHGKINPALDWMHRGWVHLVAGDMHGIRRPACMLPAHDHVRRLFDEATAQRLFCDNPRRILNGERLPDTVT